MFHKANPRPIQRSIALVSSFFASLLAATPALSQDTFTVHNVGHLSGRGQLEWGDQIIEDGRLVDVWPVYVEAGERISIVVDSLAFSPLLWVELTDANTGETIVHNVTDSSQPGRTQLDANVENDMEIRVVVTSQEMAAAQGAYSIVLSHSDLPTFVQPEAGRLEAFGVIANKDYTSNDGIPFDPLVFNSNEGDELELTVNSTDFDPVLFVFYQGDNGEIELLGANDDIDNTTTNSGMQITTPKDGTYLVVVRPFEKDTKGHYNVNIRDVNYVSTGKDRMSEAAAFSNYMHWNAWSSIMDMNSAFYGF